jgi:hypothetical protein
MAAGLAAKGTASAVGAASGVPGPATPTYMGSISANDIILCQAIVGTLSGQTMGRINPPTGFEEICQGGFRNSGGAGRGHMAFFWRRATGSESGTVSVSTTFTSTNESTIHAQLYRVTGVPTTGVPWESLSPNFTGDGSTTLTWFVSDIAASGTGRLVLAMGGQLDDAPGASTPTNYSNTVGTDTNNSNQDTQLFCFDRTNTDTAAQVTANNGETGGWATLHLVFHESAQAEISPLAFRGSATEAASDTTLAVSPTVAIPVGDLAFVVAATDNISTTQTETNDHALADTDGHTWTKLREHTVSIGGTNDGATVSLWMTKVTSEIGTGDSLTLTIGSAVTAKAMSVWRALCHPGKTWTAVDDVAAIAAASTAVSVTSSTLSSGTYYYVAGVGVERGSGAEAYDNNAASWIPGRFGISTLELQTANGGAGSGGVKGVLTADLRMASTSRTYGATLASVADWVAVLVALQSQSEGGGAPARRSLTLLGVS